MVKKSSTSKSLHRTKDAGRDWGQLAETLNVSATRNALNIASLPCAPPSNRHHETSSSIPDASETVPDMKHHRRKEKAGRSKTTSKKRADGIDETGVERAPEKKSEPKKRKKRGTGTERAPPCVPAKRPLPDVEEENRITKGKKIRKSGQDLEEASGLTSAKNSPGHQGATQLHTELKDSFLKLPKLLSLCGTSLASFVSPHTKSNRKTLKSAKISGSGNHTGKFGAAASTSKKSSSSRTNLQSSSVVGPPVKPPKPTNASPLDTSLNGTSEADEEDDEPTPLKTKKILRFSQNLETTVFEDVALDLEGGEQGESRKTATKLRERIVGGWTVKVTPTPSPMSAKGHVNDEGWDTDKEETDELDSSPVRPTKRRPSPTDGDSDEDDDDDGIESLFTPSKKRRLVDDSVSSDDNGATSGEEDIGQEVKAVVDRPPSRKVGMIVARSPPPKTTPGRDGPDAGVLSPRSTRDNDATEAPSPTLTPKTKKRVEKTGDSEKPKTRTPSKPVSPPNKLKSEPVTPKPPKRKHHSLSPNEDPAPPRKKPKIEHSTPKKEVPAPGSMPQDTKVNRSGQTKEETPLMDEEEESLLGQLKLEEQMWLVMERQAHAHWQERRRQEEVQREEKARADEARRKKEKEDQVQALRERREEYKKKQRLVKVKTAVHPVDPVEKEEVVRLKEKSRLGDMLLNERKMVNSKIQRAKQKKVQKGRSHRGVV